MDIFTYVSAQAVRYFLTRSPTRCAAGLGGVLVKSCVFVSGTWWINDCCASSNAGSSWAEHALSQQRRHKLRLSLYYYYSATWQASTPTRRKGILEVWILLMNSYDFLFLTLTSCRALCSFSSQLELNWTMTEKRIKSFLHTHYLVKSVVSAICGGRYATIITQHI